MELSPRPAFGYNPVMDTRLGILGPKVLVVLLAGMLGLTVARRMESSPDAPQGATVNIPVVSSGAAAAPPSGPSLVEAEKHLRARIEALDAQSVLLSERSDQEVAEAFVRGEEFSKDLDPTMESLAAAARKLQQEEEALAASGIGPDQPELRQVTDKRRTVTGRLTALVPVLRKRLESSTQAMKEKLALLETRPGAELRAAAENQPDRPAVAPAAEPSPVPTRVPSRGVWGLAAGLLAGLGLCLLPHPLIICGILAGLTVTIGLAGSRPPAPSPARISIGGSVRNPQLMPFAPDLTVLRAINGAGGVSPQADQRKVRLFREGKIVVVDLRAIRNDPSLDIPLRPGDTLEVPEAFW